MIITSGSGAAVTVSLTTDLLTTSPPTTQVLWAIVILTREKKKTDIKRIDLMLHD
jgi:hypothetical protein